MAGSLRLNVWSWYCRVVGFQTTAVRESTWLETDP